MKEININKRDDCSSSIVLPKNHITQGSQRLNLQVYIKKLKEIKRKKTLSIESSIRERSHEPP